MDTRRNPISIRFLLSVRHAALNTFFKETTKYNLNQFVTKCDRLSLMSEFQVNLYNFFFHNKLFLRREKKVTQVNTYIGVQSKNIMEHKWSFSLTYLKIPFELTSMTFLKERCHCLIWFTQFRTVGGMGYSIIIITIASIK